MAYIYVKSGGTATGTAGKYTSAKTGSWSTAFSNPVEYYGDLYTAYSNAGFNSGDIVYISDTHSSSVYSNIVFNATGISIISIDNDDLSVPSPGATETTNTTVVTYNFMGSRIYGLVLGNSTSAREVYIKSDSNELSSSWEFCTFKFSGSSSVTPTDCRIGSTSYNSTIYFKNCTIDFNPLSNYHCIISVLRGYVGYFNCTFLSNTSSTLMFGQAHYSADQVFIELIGCDLSSCNRPLLGDYSNPLFSQIRIERCNLYSSSNASRASYSSFMKEGVVFPNSFHFCGTSTTNNIPFIEHYVKSSIVASTTVYRDNGATCDGTTKYSLHLESSPLTSKKLKYPVRFKLTDLIVDTTNSTEFIIELLQPNSSVLLKTSDIWVELFYPDASSEKANIVSSKELLLSGHTTYPYSLESWTGLVGPVAQYISLTTNLTGKKGLCSIWIYSSLESPNIYICPRIKLIQ